MNIQPFLGGFQVTGLGKLTPRRSTRLLMSDESVQPDVTSVAQLGLEWWPAARRWAAAVVGQLLTGGDRTE